MIMKFFCDCICELIFATFFKITSDNFITTVRKEQVPDGGEPWDFSKALSTQSTRLSSPGTRPERKILGLDGLKLEWMGYQNSNEIHDIKYE